MLSKKLIGGVLALVLAYYVSNRNCCSQKKEGKTVETKSGSVRGIISLSRDGREYYEWLGIPYAKPPVGSLRFASPQPLDKKWDGVLDGKTYGSACAQVDIFQGNIMGQEDCLFLNIHAPKVETKKLLPVMFFIHGGYFVSGSADQYKPQYFMDEEVLLVTINYRLAALGFLSTGDASIRGNMGLKDQSLALKWIKENIANFGGDPNQITIFGESAGSASVHFQMISPKSQGLMQRAISQSGSAMNTWAMNDNPGSQAKRFAGKLNCPLESSTEMAKCLRNTDINKLLAVHLETVNPVDRKKEAIFVPTVETVIDEETFLPDHPTNLYKNGKISKIPWLTGLNADEGLLFGAYILTKEDYRHRLETDPNFVSEVGLHLNPSEAKSINKIIEFYFGKEEKLDLLEKFAPAVQLLTDRWFSYGIHKAALAHAQFASTQLYYYNKTGPSLFDFMVLLEGKYPAFVEVLLGITKKWFNSVILGQPPKSYGVCHADELVMMFDMMNIFWVPKGDPNYEFSKDLVKTWVSFASTKNVEGIEFRGSKFPLLSPKGDVKVIEINDVPAIKKFPIEDRLRFWDSI